MPEPPAPTAAPEETYTKADVERIVKDRLERAQRKAAEQQEAARREAEAKALAEQGEFKTLAEQRQAEIDELHARIKDADTLAKERDRYAGALKAQLQAAKDGLPPHIVTILDKLDPVEQLEWIAANREHLRKGDGVGSPNPGTKTPATFDLPRPTATI
jgi:hypothetical protein